MKKCDVMKILKEKNKMKKRFWKEAEPNGKGFIELEVTVINPEDEYDADKMKQVESTNVNSGLSQASVGDNLWNGGCSSQPSLVVEDEDNVDVDDCHPVEKMEPPVLFDSDEDNDRDYVAEFGKMYQGEEDVSDEEDDEEGDEVEDKHVQQQPDWFEPFKSDYKNYFDKDEEEPMFPEYEDIPTIDPSIMVVGTTFASKGAFKRHLRDFCGLKWVPI
ncbi:hypothetical protein C5167_032874 [Papaver somniferum]|uniref:Uncharacterized protein n=1 Tax=Papaver somniferum TaxID=3469 RepID=A0A4Y7KA22_PAPSO|nr:hypothetical protein C5167_032874 [Papaver somniferum]